MKQPIQAVIFDMDGLMFDTERISFLCFSKALKTYNLTLDELFFGRTIGTNIKVTEQLYLEQFGADLPFAKVYRQKALFVKQYIETHNVPVKKGLYELLAFLRQHKIKTAVATSSNRENALHLLNSAQVANYFDYILCGDEVTKSKPEPEIFLKTAEKLSCTPQNCLVLEDSPKGILAAHRAGMKVILIPDMAEVDETTKNLAMTTLHSLSEVADYLNSENLIKKQL